MTSPTAKTETQPGRQSIASGMLSYGLAFLAVGLALLLRWWADPILKDQLPFAPFYLAVAFAVWRGGLGPALAALVAGYLAANYFFIQPRHDLVHVLAHHAAVLLGYLSVTGAITALGVVYRLDKRRVDSLLQASLQHNARLDTEMQVRRQAEEALRKSQSLLEALTDNSPALVFIKDLNGQYLMINRRYEHVFERRKEEMLGRTDEAIFPPEVAECLRENDREVLAARESRRFEEIVPQSDGLHSYVSVKFPLLNAAGQAYAVGGIAMDMTDVKRTEMALRDSEARLQLAQNGAGVGLWDWNVTTGQAFWSDLTWNFYGYPPRSQAVTYDLWRSGLYPEDRERACQVVADALASGTDYTDEFRISRPDGNVRWVSSRGRVLRDENGQPVRMIGIHIDVNHLKQVEEDLRAAQQQLAEHARNLEKQVAIRTAHLEEALRSLELLLYNIAHDLRAPSRTMEGFAQLLLAKYGPTLDATARDYLQRIAVAARRNDTLIVDLLAYGRLSHVELSCLPVSLGACVQAVLARLQPEIKAADAAITVQEPLPEVWAHPAALDQIFTQLLTNALKFVAPGVRPVVTIYAEDGPRAVRFCVQDNGIGIAPEYHGKIFEVFHRLLETDAFSGTGIGLAIVQKAVARIGGRVGVESAPGKGSCFWVELARVEQRNSSPRGAIQ